MTPPLARIPGLKTKWHTGDSKALGNLDFSNALSIFQVMWCQLRPQYVASAPCTHTLVPSLLREAMEIMLKDLVDSPSSSLSSPKLYIWSNLRSFFYYQTQDFCFSIREGTEHGLRSVTLVSVWTTSQLPTQEWTGLEQITGFCKLQCSHLHSRHKDDTCIHTPGTEKAFNKWWLLLLPQLLPNRMVRILHTFNPNSPNAKKVLRIKFA